MAQQKKNRIIISCSFLDTILFVKLIYHVRNL